MKFSFPAFTIVFYLMGGFMVTYNALVLILKHDGWKRDSLTFILLGISSILFFIVWPIPVIIVWIWTVVVSVRRTIKITRKYSNE